MLKKKKILLVPHHLNEPTSYKVKETYNTLKPAVGDILSEKELKYYVDDIRVQVVIKEK